jgi:transcriptional regulator with XRE-family HTH domain
MKTAELPVTMGTMSDRDTKRAGRYVFARRGELGMTQEQLARVAHVDPKTINTFEHGDRWPWARNIAKIESGLGWPRLTLDRISAGGEPDQPPPDATIPADAPVCTFERSVLAETAISDATKAQLVRVHRDGKHVNCRPIAEEDAAVAAARS